MSADRPPVIAHFIRVFAVPILLGWVALVVLLNVAVPPWRTWDRRARCR